MIQLKRFSLLFLFSLFAFSSLKAQHDPYRHTKRYFKDRIGASKNLIKTDLFALGRGELALHYERILSPKISLEVHYGKVFAYLNPSLDNFITTENISDKSKGYSYSIQFRNYISRLAPERYYTTLMYRYRKLDGLSRSIEDAVCGIGMQQHMGKFWLWDAALLAGTRAGSNNTEEKPDGKAVPIIFLQAKIAYLF